MIPQLWAVIASTGSAYMTCAAFETEQEARADFEQRARKYPAWFFYITPARKG
jgi:hypothetical protein